MSGFSDQFTAHLVPSQPEIAEAMREGLVVLDTNVLLSAYRFAPKAREELLSVLEQVADRVWIPHQVAFEFHKNRFGVIAEHDAAYKELLDALSEHRRTMQLDLETKIRQLSNRSALTDAVRDELLHQARQSLDPLQSEIERLHQAHRLGEPAESDNVLERLQLIFADHVGPAFSPEEQERANKEASRRIDEKVPPGFKDSGKSNPSGDYFLWAQTLIEVERCKPKFLVLVTGDVKDDWYLRVKGQTVIGRPELANELQARTGARLMLMPTKSFLRHAREYLNAAVSSDTLTQAGRVAEVQLLQRAVESAAKLEAQRDALLGSVETAQAEVELSRAEVRRIVNTLSQISDRESSAYKEADAELQEAIGAYEKLRSLFTAAQSRLQELDARLNELQNLVIHGAESGDRTDFETKLAKWLRLIQR
ncbi:PIN-like domain-containing protein [Micromonospora sp. NPDC047467]|uniref:PIN-like domain-containing protein n=1 Tax=Micromonospora sp. NPDC047467 TaxID=3154814 RepID=UPI0033ED7763